MTRDAATPPPPELPEPPPDALDRWIERRVAAIREDRERMREELKRWPWARFSPPF